MTKLCSCVLIIGVAVILFSYAVFEIESGGVLPKAMQMEQFTVYEAKI